ncbi:hypothetical protein Ddye_025701 [Dipteronia dyeriana]|uniref:Nuclease HARBI1 n=1 Tax=Dipteronia dyeriana TaxID=168575 RepID=A0AAD9WNS2_9ROSI|nr:hypothetical protein Ddye_025701 [Dipteronia dyeriana]
MFRRRFRMGRSLFLRIVEKVEARDNCFIQRRDSVRRLGLSALQKITAVFRMLAYGFPADASDEYIKIGESTTIESLKRICRAVVEEFTGEYLRSPNATDVARLLRIGKDRDFPGMLGSLDYMHWKWKNCPMAWAGQYAGPACFWHKHILHDIMTTCIIMHNMIIADERDVTASIEDHMEAPSPEVEMVLDEST